MKHKLPETGLDQGAGALAQLSPMAKGVTTKRGWQSLPVSLNSPQLCAAESVPAAKTTMQAIVL